MPSLTQTTPSWVKDLKNDTLLNGTRTSKKSSRAVMAERQPLKQQGLLFGEEKNENSGFLDDPPQVEKTPARTQFEQDKTGFERALGDAGTAVGRVFEDLFREVVPVNEDMRERLNQLEIKIQVLNIQQGIDEYNEAARFWNASVPDRKQALRPLKTRKNETIWGLNVSVEQLEAYPDAIKAALLLHMGSVHANAATRNATDITDDLDDQIRMNLQEKQAEANLLTPFDDRSNDEKEVISASAPTDTRLTKQLRAAVGLAPIGL